MNVSILPTPLAPLTERALRPAAVAKPMSERATLKMQLRRVLVSAIQARIETGASVQEASLHLHTRLQLAEMSSAEQLAWQRLGEPAACTMAKWLRSFKTDGLKALAPKNKGRVRKVYGWEARAVALYAQPQRPAYATVALWLTEEGFSGAQEHNVRRYLQKLPSNLTETSPKRTGGHYYTQNIKPHKVRDTSELPVGLIYEGDGHCCDVYVAAPATGNPYRPELTVWLDVRSHRVVGWWLSESESAETTLFSLSHALISNNHTPAFVHTDPGSGFKARIITDSQSGFLARFSIQAMLALPGNAKGKGLTEGWFRWFEERLGKRFATFCGHCRTDDALSRLRERIRRGEMALPSLAEYRAAVAAFMASYNARPQESLGGASPDDLWQQLDRVPLEVPEAAVLCPRVTRTVRRWGVELHGRLYRGAELQSMEGREVLVEYSLHSDAVVRVLTTDGLFVGDAQLLHKTAWLPDSRIVEGQQRRLEGQQNRLQVALDEAKARSRSPIAASALLAALSHDGSLPAEPAVRQRALQQVAAAIEAEEEDARHQTPAQRFARYQQLQAQPELLQAAELAWFESYPNTSEYRARYAIWEHEQEHRDTESERSEVGAGAVLCGSSRTPCSANTVSEPHQ